MQSNKTQEASENIPVLPFYLFVLGNNLEAADALTWIDLLLRISGWESLLHLSKMNNPVQVLWVRGNTGYLEMTQRYGTWHLNGIILYFLIEVLTA